MSLRISKFQFFKFRKKIVLSALFLALAIPSTLLFADTSPVVIIIPAHECGGCPEEE